jgi:hypothetical protein
MLNYKLINLVFKQCIKISRKKVVKQKSVGPVGLSGTSALSKKQPAIE